MNKPIPLQEHETRSKIEKIVSRKHVPIHSIVDDDYKIESDFQNIILSVPATNFRPDIDCKKFVFGEKNTLRGDHYFLWYDTLNFMTGNGFKPHTNPSKGDIIAYMDWSEKSNKWEATHWGFVSHQAGWVESKWGRRSLFKHAIDIVPAEYGTHYIFFSKN